MEFNTQTSLYLYLSQTEKYSVLNVVVCICLFVHLLNGCEKLWAKIGSLESCFLSSCSIHNLFWFILNHVNRIMLKVNVSLFFVSFLFLKLLVFPLSRYIFYTTPGILIFIYIGTKTICCRI